MGAACINKTVHFDKFILIIITFNNPLLGSPPPPRISKENLRLRIPSDFGLEARSCPACAVQTTLPLLSSYCQGSSKFTLGKQLPSGAESPCPRSRYIGQVWRKPLMWSSEPHSHSWALLGLRWPPGKPCSLQLLTAFSTTAQDQHLTAEACVRADGGLITSEHVYRKEDGQQMK